MYLAEYADKLMLLDGASRADIPHLKDFIEYQLKRPFTDLKLVVVTHMHPNQYRLSVKRVFELQPSCLLLAHGGEVVLDEKAYRHILDTAPTKPHTHWRATKIKAKGLFSVLLRRNKR
ncbi:MAG: hypothetical protein GYB23_16535 [Vibrionaceae bacterium]|nr:hypothetical protein [Vibrionaceae bacterium]